MSTQIRGEVVGTPRRPWPPSRGGWARAATVAAALICCSPWALRVMAQAPEVGLSPRAVEARADVRRILASPDYGGGTGKSFVERIGDALLSPLRQLWDWLKEKLAGLHLPAPSDGLGGVMVTIMYVVLVAGAVMLVAWAITLLARRSAARSDEEDKGPVVSSSANEEPDPAIEPDAWIVLARKHAADGDLRAAYRAAFTGVLVRLDRLGAIRYERQRTNGEYLRALRGHPPFLAALRPAARDFDARWYGRLPVSEADYERMLSTYQRIAGSAAS